MREYSVSLNIIGAAKKIAKRLRAVICENPEKTISMTFFGPEPLFSDNVVHFSTGSPCLIE